MNVLVTGSKGQLGTHIRLLGETSSNHYIFTDVDELDITNDAAVWSFFRHNPIDVVINCAAYTNVDRAEDDEATASLINAHAVRLLADAAKSSDATLIHFSTR